jgi:outer membrane protein assembly factor BamD (BamD/ComL family)
LRAEQARGALQIARFYEGKHSWDGAKVYYNEVLVADPTSKYGEEAKRRIEAINKITAKKTARN